MSIKIIKNDKPSLKKNEMTCDKPLHKKLDNYEVLKFMNCHSTNLLIGKPKSGKTSLLISLFGSPSALKKCFHNIFLFMPTASQKSMKDDIFESIPEEQKFNELNEENLFFVRGFLEAEEKCFNNCIILDDMGAFLKNADNMRALKELVMNRRHLRLSIFFLTQTYYSVPREIRKLFSNLFVFRVSKPELQAIMEEQAEWIQDKAMTGKISKLVFDKLYNWLFINVDSQRFFKMWDEIIIEE